MMKRENLSPFVHLGPGYFCHLSRSAQRWAQNLLNFDPSPQLCWTKKALVLPFPFCLLGVFFGGCAKNTGETFFLVAVASVFFLFRSFFFWLKGEDNWSDQLQGRPWANMGYYPFFHGRK